MSLKTRFEFIRFEKIADKPKTSVWRCVNNRHGEHLGEVRWYGPWRQYCYFPTVQAVYSAGCLTDIAEFMRALKPGGDSGS